MSDAGWKLTECEMAAARASEPLPFDASWSTGDDAFDARIHATMLDVERRIAAAVAAERAKTEDLMIAAWNLGHLNASQSDEAYPPKIQRPIDIAAIRARGGK